MFTDLSLKVAPLGKAVRADTKFTDLSLQIPLAGASKFTDLFLQIPLLICRWVQIINLTKPKMNESRK